MEVIHHHDRIMTKAVIHVTLSLQGSSLVSSYEHFVEIHVGSMSFANHHDCLASGFHSPRSLTISSLIITRPLSTNRSLFLGLAFLCLLYPAFWSVLVHLAAATKQERWCVCSQFTQHGARPSDAMPWHSICREHQNGSALFLVLVAEIPLQF